MKLFNWLKPKPKEKPVESIEVRCLSCLDGADGAGYCQACGKTWKGKPPTFTLEDINLGD